MYDVAWIVLILYAIIAYGGNQGNPVAQAEAYRNILGGLAFITAWDILGVYGFWACSTLVLGVALATLLRKAQADVKSETERANKKKRKKRPRAPSPPAEPPSQEDDDVVDAEFTVI